VTSDVEVQNPATPVPDHEETIQKPEGQRGHGKEIHGGDRLPMIGKEREPAPGRIATAWPQPSKISGNRAFGDGEAEFQQFPVDLWRAPVRILNRHAADESPHLFAHLWPTAARPGSPAPVQPKTRPMPCDHFRRLHDDQNIRPARPNAPKNGPEEAIGAAQGRSRAFAFEDGDLLPQGEDLKRSLEATAKEDAQSGEECGDEIEHETTVVTLCNVSAGPAVHRRNLLISESRQPFDYRQRTGLRP
jgi:hypothetical protein